MITAEETELLLEIIGLVDPCRNCGIGNDELDQARTVIERVRAKTVEALGELPIAAPFSANEAALLSANIILRTQRDDLYKKNREGIEASTKSNQEFCQAIGRWKEKLAEETEAFRNFHRRLSERFGYGHDPIHWKRDQMSLEEHIARCLAEIEEARTNLGSERDNLLNDRDSWQKKYEELHRMTAVLSGHHEKT
jgi:hypothetical protein